MNRLLVCAAALSMTTLVAGCNDAPRTVAVPAVPPPASSAPTVIPVPIPPMTSGAVAPSETAKDTPANTPMGTLSKDEESKAMPMAGQANNHSSTALDAAKK